MKLLTKQEVQRSMQPTLGYLVDLCEENYQLLLRLAPGLAQMKGAAHSSRPNSQDLHLEILEQSPYTTLVHLTYRFAREAEHAHEPDAILRVYHDAVQVEIVHLQQDILPVKPAFHPPALLNKWRANQFLSRWLRFCEQQGHQFA